MKCAAPHSIAIALLCPRRLFATKRIARTLVGGGSSWAGAVGDQRREVLCYIGRGDGLVDRPSDGGRCFCSPAIRPLRCQPHGSFHSPPFAARPCTFCTLSCRTIAPLLFARLRCRLSPCDPPLAVAVPRAAHDNRPQMVQCTRPADQGTIIRTERSRERCAVAGRMAASRSAGQWTTG